MTTPAAPLQDEIQALLQKHPPIIPATRIDTNTAIYVRVSQRREDKVTKFTSALEVKVNELIAKARKRRSYVHAIAMRSLTPAQYARALPQLTSHGYGVNVFPIHHIHPPLSMAVLGGHVKAAHALLQHGADPYLSYPSTHDYSSPLQMVCEQLLRFQDGRFPKKFKTAQAMMTVFLKHGVDLKRKMHPSKGDLTFWDYLANGKP
jgi:ankyrin repeat protein